MWWEKLMWFAALLVIAVSNLACFYIGGKVARNEPVITPKPKPPPRATLQSVNARNRRLTEMEEASEGEFEIR